MNYSPVRRLSPGNSRDARSMPNRMLGHPNGTSDRTARTRTADVGRFARSVTGESKIEQP
jgi:hypothetical protein